jgi:putative ABC transport system permease protein
MSVGLLFATWILPTFAGVSFIVGICAGIYPAVLLSSLNPSMVVKGKLSIKPGTLINGFRNVLMITQFSVSIFLIAGTLIIYKQLQYIQDKNVGFNRTRVLVIKNASLLNNPKLFKESMKQIPAISSASLANFLPTNNTRWSNYGWSVKVTNPVETEFWPVDEDYLATMDLQIIAGRNFSKNISSDSSAIILNEAAAKIFSFKNDLVNQSIVYNFHQQQKIFSVIGIVRDFNFNSLREHITPLVMLLSDNIQSSLIVKMETDNLPAVMSDINNQWKKMAPGQQMDYSFMDDDFNAIYKNDQLMGRLFLIFSALAILIACLGLFGLSIHSMEVRNREIGIRKVLGAPVFSLIFLLSKDFIQLVIIAILVTTPIAYVAMFNWINQFAYRQTIRLYDFGIAALIALLIALGTVISLTLMTTKINPVKILKNP